jgi:Outer membrane protein beta-barrel domain
MKKLLICFSCLPAFVAAQNFHFSARAGMAAYNGDLKVRSISLSQPKLMFSLGARYDVTERIAARTYFTLTSLRADDKKGTVSMKQRNLNFKSKIFDWEGGIQYSILNPNDSWWVPYVSAGVGIFHFKPYTNDAGGNKAFLKPLSTEGQVFIQGIKEYKLTQLSIPLGIGIERSFNEDMRAGLEIGYRKTFTDYIDDVSGAYVNEAALLAARGPLAVDLAYRGDEVGAGASPGLNSFRGNDNGKKDGYIYIALTFTIRHFFDKYKKIAGMPGGRKEKRAGCPGSKVR